MQLDLELFEECTKEQSYYNKSREYDRLNMSLRKIFDGRVYVQNNNQYSMAKDFFKKAEVIKTGMISYTLQASETKNSKLTKEAQKLIRELRTKYKKNNNGSCTRNRTKGNICN